MGNTALTKLPAIGKELGLDLYIKDETRNPTWGHKDRLNAVLINKAMELGGAWALCTHRPEIMGHPEQHLQQRQGMPCVILTVKGVQ